MWRIDRTEFWQGLPLVTTITAGVIVGGMFLTTVMMAVIGFHDASLHYALAVIFPVIITPCAAYPLVIMSQRLQKMRAELEGLLRVDGLTAIPNRRAFFERAATVFSHKSTAAAMMIDIDHFKRVNDIYGHAIGDVVLSEVGHRIEHVVKAAPQGGARITARIGGEEFAALIEDLEPKEAGRLAQHIVEHIRATPVIAGDLVIPVTVSVGVASRTTEASADQLLRLADGACYRAKGLGRDRCCRADAGDRPNYTDSRTAHVRHLAAVG